MDWLLIVADLPFVSAFSHQKTFTWEGLNYHVPSPNGPLRLLHDVYGYVKPGTLTALMGASGAGMSYVALIPDSDLRYRQAKPLVSMFWLNARILVLFLEMSSLRADLSTLISHVEQLMVCL